MLTKEIIGKKIREKRIEKKLTQQQLATILKSSRSSITDWENFRNLPNAILFSELLKVLNIDVRKL